MKYRIYALTLVHAISTLLAAPVEKYEVETEYQNGKQEIRVLLPDDYKMTRSYQVLYVLPVEKAFRKRFGYGLGVLEEMNAHNRYNLIIVQMGFEKEPWFGDHATDPKVRQASYVKEYVVPFIEKNYSTLGTSEGRLLLGFSKSGWGVQSDSQASRLLRLRRCMGCASFFHEISVWDGISIRNSQTASTLPARSFDP